MLPPACLMDMDGHTRQKLCAGAANCQTVWRLPLSDISLGAGRKCPCVPLGKKSAEASRTPRLHKSPPPQPWAHHHHPHHQRKLSPPDSINETIAIETGKNIVRCRETKKSYPKASEDVPGVWDTKNGGIWRYSDSLSDNDRIRTCATEVNSLRDFEAIPLTTLARCLVLVMIQSTK